MPSDGYRITGIEYGHGRKNTRWEWVTPTSITIRGADYYANSSGGYILHLAR